MANKTAIKLKNPFKRAKDADGKFQADDPSTPDVNEAWVDEEGNYKMNEVEHTHEDGTTHTHEGGDVPHTHEEKTVAKKEKKEKAPKVETVKLRNANTGEFFEGPKPAGAKGANGKVGGVPYWEV